MHLVSKKTILALLLALLVLVGAGFLLSGNDETAKDTENSGPTVTRKALYEGIARSMETMNEDSQFTISMLVPGSRIDENTWNFNGTLRGETADRPFFGDIKLICPVAETLACWQLQKLVIDGTPYTLVEGTQTNTADLLPEEQETLVLDDADAVVPETNEDATPSSDTPKATLDIPAVEESKTYNTVSNNVNARMGPGGNFDIAFKMPSTVTLTLLKQDGKWGHFEYVGANDVVGQIWIAMSLVKEAQ